MAVREIFNVAELFSTGRHVLSNSYRVTYGNLVTVSFNSSSKQPRTLTFLLSPFSRIFHWSVEVRNFGIDENWNTNNNHLTVLVRTQHSSISLEIPKIACILKVFLILNVAFLLIVTCNVNGNEHFHFHFFPKFTKISLFVRIPTFPFLFDLALEL